MSDEILTPAELREIIDDYSRLIDKLTADKQNLTTALSISEHVLNEMTRRANQAETANIEAERSDGELVEQLNARATSAEAALAACQEELQSYHESEKEMVLKSLHFEDNQFTAILAHPMFYIFQQAISEMFIDQGAVNYLESTMHSDKIGDFTVTVQTVKGKTPYQLQKEAEAALADMTADRNTAAQAAKVWREKCQTDEMRADAGMPPKDAPAPIINPWKPDLPDAT
jgi:hypothetical protein